MTKMTQKCKNTSRTWKGVRRRNGVVAVLGAICLVVVFAFVAMGVDVGRVLNTQTKMQAAVDAASLASSQEITDVIWTTAQSGGEVNYDQAVAAARQTAATVASQNGVYVDPDNDVQFGTRYYDDATQRWLVDWGVSPYNAVKVTARRDQADTREPDGRLMMSFGWAVGMGSVEIISEANAFVEARDIVTVLDYSGSMNDDSELSSNLPLADVEANLDQMWTALVTQDPKWPESDVSKFPSTGFGAVNSAEGTYVSSGNVDTIFEELGLDQLDVDGNPVFPFPQAGKANDGTPNGVPNAETSEDLWKDYISYVKDIGGDYQKKYGYRTMMDYFLDETPTTYEAEDLWRTPHYPFQSMKQGVTLFTEFLGDIGYGDKLGLVTYDTNARVETGLNEYGTVVDLGSSPLTYDYQAIDTIQRHKQARHYGGGTGLGFGIKEAKQLLDVHGRMGAHKTILVMTDGQANKRPDGWSLPDGWNWDEVTDFDDDGQADYTTNDASNQYAFYEAREAILAGYTVHTMSLGAGADASLMEALSKAGGGVWINVPGGSTTAHMTTQVSAGFSQIAAEVPPAKLFYEEVIGGDGSANEDENQDGGSDDDDDDDGDHDNGHGNDDDGVDESNPGQGHGGPNGSNNGHDDDDDGDDSG